MAGIFDKLIGRSAEDVAKDRMEDIKKYAKVSYKQKIELIRVKIEELKNNRMKLLDAYNEDSQIITKNFDMRGYVNKDIAAGVDIMNEETVLKLAEEQYEILFGEKSMIVKFEKPENNNVNLRHSKEVDITGKLPSFNDHHSTEGWDRCPRCHNRARHPITGEFYMMLQDTLTCPKCHINWIPENN